VINSEIIERLRCFARIEEVGRRQRKLGESGRGVEDAHDALGLRVGQWLQQHCLDDAVDRASSANAESQRQDGDENEARARSKRTKCIANVMTDGVHRVSFSFRYRRP